MGAWGAGIFSDDLASDVREDYRQAIIDGASSDEAKASLCKRYSDTLDDPDEGPVFWLALASTAWSMGRLDDELRDRALGVIRDGAGLDRWDDPASRRLRIAALQKLGEKLVQPQRPPTRPKKKPRFSTSWQVNEIVGFRTGSGKWMLLHVTGIDRSDEADFPIVTVLDWLRVELPVSQEDLEGVKPMMQMPYNAKKGGKKEGVRRVLCLSAKDEKSDDMRRTGLSLKQRRSPLQWLRGPLPAPKSFAGPKSLDALSSVISS